VDQAFGNSGNGKLKRKTEIVKMKIINFGTARQRKPALDGDSNSVTTAEL